MNEHEFRDALRATMTAVAQPPPMGGAAVLDAARRDRRRRRTMWAGAGSALAVAAIAVGVVVVVPSNDAGGGNGVGTTPSSTPPGPPPTDEEKLTTALKSVVPAGYGSPDDLMGTGQMRGVPMQDYELQEGTVDGQPDVYLHHNLHIPVTRGDGVGQLYVMVSEPGDPTLGEGCDLLGGMNWGVNDGECTEVMVDGKRVGMITDPTPGDAPDDQDPFEQWASYQHEDGVQVAIAQASYRESTDFPPLDGPVFTTEQLVELVTDPRFRLD
jgi:hypothetical protein